MNVDKKRKGARGVAIVCAIAMFFLLLMVGAMQFIGGTETRISSDSENSKIGSFFCIATQVKGAFFDFGNEIDLKHEVKYTFNGNEVDKVSYTYTGNYNTEQDAKKAANDFHVKYNQYMGKIDIYQEDLTPVFTQNDKKVIINIFMKRDNFTIDTAVFVFMDMDEYKFEGKYSIVELEEMYNNKGFSCVNSE